MTPQKPPLAGDAEEIAASRIRAGRWEAALYRPGANAPQVELWLGDDCIGTVDTRPGGAEGMWLLQATIPPNRLADGIQTFLLRDAQSGETLAHFTILAGATVERDIRAEVDLLRAELDMLKKAFRQHCARSGD